jgi:hypothetical protein
MIQTIPRSWQVFFPKRGEKPAWRRDAIRFDVGAWGSRSAASNLHCGDALRKGNLHRDFPL